MIYNANGDFKIYEGDSWKKECLPLCAIIGPIYPEAKFSGYQYFNDFIYKGETYYINSVVKLSKDAQKFLGIDNQHTQIIQHEITCTKIERWGYFKKFDNGKTYKVFTTVAPDQLIEEVTIPAELTNAKRKTQYYKDNEVEGMHKLWAIYIIIMIGTMILNNFILVWIATTIIFFNVRKEKLKKPDQHYYGY